MYKQVLFLPVAQRRGQVVLIVLLVVVLGKTFVCPASFWAKVLSLRFENACSCCSWEDVCLINLPYLPSNFYQSRRDVVKWCFIQSFSFSCILHHFNFCWSQVGMLSFGKLIFYVLKNFSHLWIFIFFVWEFCYFSALLYEFYCLNSYPRDW